MATKKQIKRRRKVRVHGAPERSERSERPAPAPRPERAAARATSGRQRARGRRHPTAGARRPPPEPSWGRSIRISLMMIAVVAVAMYFLLPAKHRLSGIALYAVGMGALYIPINYYVMRSVHRRFVRSSEG